MTERRPTKLPRWHEWAIYLSFGALALTGLAWLTLSRWVRVEGEFGPQHHPLEQLMLILHGAAAYAMLTVAGALIPVHVKGGWMTGHNRWTGSIMGGVLGVLGLTALALYYLGAESVRGWSSFAHWTIGVASVPLLVIHVIRGRRDVTRQRAASPRHRDRPKRGG